MIINQNHIPSLLYNLVFPANKINEIMCFQTTVKGKHIFLISVRLVMYLPQHPLAQVDHLVQLHPEITKKN